MIKISTSILSSDSRIDSIKKLNNTKNDFLHIDCMDGIFVPNTQMPTNEIIDLERYSIVPLDVHLMTEDPEKYIENLENKNIKYITIHEEINKDLHKIIHKIKSLGYSAGISIKPNTDINNLDEYLDEIDLILIMSVEPGLGGQKFILNSLNRADKIKDKIKNKNIVIEMDGGINDSNIDEIKKHIDIAVVGSYITKSSDYNKAINNLKN